MTSYIDQFTIQSKFISTPSSSEELAPNQPGFLSLFRQILGKQNLFGYSSTITNQLHLMYYFLGEFYVSNLFSNRTRWFCRLFNALNGTLLLAQCFSCVLLSSDRQETSKILYNTQIITTVAYYLIVTPALACINRAHTFEALKVLDLQMRSFDTDSRRPKYHTLGVISILIVVQIILMTFYCSSTLTHFIFGYDSDNLKNSNYYLFPVYCDYVDTPVEYLILLSSQMMFSLPTLASPYLIPLFVILSADRYYDKFQELGDALDGVSRKFESRFEHLLQESYDTKQIRIQRLKLVTEYTRDIQSHARLHHDLLRGINHLKYYLQSSVSISLAMFLMIEVMLFYIFILLENESLLLRIKILTFAIGICNILFVNCAAGNLFAKMGDMFRDTVYNTPWYYLPSLNRKSVYLLLYQSQVTIGFRSLRIYPMNMELFDRFCRYVYSAVSVLAGYHRAH